MSTKVKKDYMHTIISGDIDSLSTKDRRSMLKDEYTLAIRILPDYAAATAEMLKYTIDLPQNPDYSDLSEINKLYALAQSYSSRITALEMIAIDNQARWKRLTALLTAYIEDKQSELLASSEFEEYTVQKAQAKAHTLLKKEFKTLRVLQDKFAEADSFYRMITAKKKDLVSILTTLGKQVKALSLEKSIQ